MSWFKRKKKNDIFEDFEIVVKDIPLSTLMRWFIYDVGLGEPNDLSKLLGMNPVSEEGNEKEMEDSDIRLDSINTLLPFLHTMAEMSADLITSIQIDEIEKSDSDAAEEILRETDIMKTLYKVVALSSLIGAFSSAMDIGLIAPGDVSNASLEEKEL